MREYAIKVRERRFDHIEPETLWTKLESLAVEIVASATNSQSLIFKSSSYWGSQFGVVKFLATKNGLDYALARPSTLEIFLGRIGDEVFLGGLRGNLTACWFQCLTPETKSQRHQVCPHLISKPLGYRSPNRCSIMSLQLDERRVAQEFDLK